MSPTALVTGANKGIGFCIAKNLAMKGFSVFIGCRDVSRGTVAQKALQEAAPGAQIRLVKLDIGSEESINAAANEIATSCKDGIDVLVNNAAMAYKVYSPAPFAEQAEATIAINYFGTLKMCEYFIPLLRKGADPRIINISSRMGSPHKIKDLGLRDEILSPNLTISRLSSIMEDFVKHAVAGTHLTAGWPNSAYSVSKIGVTALTKVLARTNPEIKVFACCPGWCKTDMAGWDSAPKSAEQGSDTPTWLADDKQAVSGEMYAERRLMKF